MYMKSTNGEIEVFLCPDDTASSESDLKPTPAQLDDSEYCTCDRAIEFLCYSVVCHKYMLLHYISFSVSVGEHYMDVSQQQMVPNQPISAIDAHDDMVSILPDTNQIDLEALGLLIKTETKSEPTSVCNEPVSQDEGHSEGWFYHYYLYCCKLFLSCDKTLDCVPTSLNHLKFKAIRITSVIFFISSTVLCRISCAFRVI